MTRGLVWLAAALIVACAADAGAQTTSQQTKSQQTKSEKTQAAPKPKAVHQLPLHAYLAKGEPNACGEGCSEWIAIEGRFVSGSGASIIAFLKRHAARKLPVYFHSPGGSELEAMAIGRQLRQLGITVGAAATVPRGCASAGDTGPVCAAAKRSPQPVTAEWRPAATCSSSCVWALLGGKVRHVPPSARLGVHATKYTLMRKWSNGRVQQVSPDEAAYKTRAAEAIAGTRRYVREMGIDTALVDAAQKIPHEDIRYLSRDEIAAFGIDRREFAESPWFLTEPASGLRYVSKWIVEAKGAERKEYRMSVIAFVCASPSRATLRYMRGRTSSEVGQPTTATMVIGKHRTQFILSGPGTKQDTVDPGSLFSSASGGVPFDAIEAAAALGTIGYDTDARPGTKPSQLIELSTFGLADAIKQLREKCVPVAQAVPWVPRGKGPFGPTQSGSVVWPANPLSASPALVAPGPAAPVPEVASDGSEQK